jgi:hypothetical protein
MQVHEYQVSFQSTPQLLKTSESVGKYGAFEFEFEAQSRTILNKEPKPRADTSAQNEEVLVL